MHYWGDILKNKVKELICPFCGKKIVENKICCKKRKIVDLMRKKIMYEIKM